MIEVSRDSYLLVNYAKSGMLCYSVFVMRLGILGMIQLILSSLVLLLQFFAIPVDHSSSTPLFGFQALFSTPRILVYLCINVDRIVRDWTQLKST